MPNIPYRKEAVEIAKAEGLHLLILSIDGRHAKRGSASLAGPIGPETARRVWELFAELCDVEKRMK